MSTATLRNSLLFATLLGVSIAPTAAAQKLTGAGATFPNPIYTKWFDAYNKKTGLQINYQSIGSGGGSALSLARASASRDCTMSGGWPAPQPSPGSGTIAST